MRALLLAMTTILASCSVTVDTDNLAGGTRPGTDAGVPADAVADTATCNPDDCLDDALVVPLASIAPCTKETTDKVGCRQKVFEACRAKDPCCYKGGYGPVAFPNDAEATILCFVEPTYDAPVSEILAASPGCVASALASRACDYAVHVSATKRGKTTGILQTVEGETATIVGIEFADSPVDVDWTELAKNDPACTQANAEKQACTNAVQVYCTTGENEGYLGGTGPFQPTATGASVVCF